MDSNVSAMPPIDSYSARVAAAVAAAMQQADVTQQQLDEAGVIPQSTLSRRLRFCTFTVPEVEAIAAYLGLPTEQLIAPAAA